MLGGSSALPADLRRSHTEGERAGVCDLANQKITALAGVSLATAHKIFRKAKELGHIRITDQPCIGPTGKETASNRTDAIEIIASEWTMWTRRVPEGRWPERVHFREKGVPNKDECELHFCRRKDFEAARGCPMGARGEAARESWRSYLAASQPRNPPSQSPGKRIRTHCS